MITEKYIFHCKLKGEPVCVEWTGGEGFRAADELVKFGVWKPQTGKVLSWIVLYPTIIDCDGKKYEMEENYCWTLGIE